MKSTKIENDKIHFLPKPNINLNNLNYLEKGQKDVYANLFEIKINKKLMLYQYPFSVFPDIGEGDYRIRSMLFKACSKNLKEIYGECFISGDSLYGMKKVEEKQIIKCKLILKDNPTDYFMELQKYAKEKIIRQQDVKIDPLAKQFIEILIKDILHSNPNLEFYKGFFVWKNEKKTINTQNAQIFFYPGITTSFMETDNGNYLNVTLKNKIIQKDTILDYLNEHKYYDKNNQEDIAKKLIGRSFKVSYSKRNYIIYDILFNRNPTNQTFNYEGGTEKLIDY